MRKYIWAIYSDNSIWKFEYIDKEPFLLKMKFTLKNHVLNTITLDKKSYFFTKKEAYKEVKKRYIKLYKQKEKELKAIDKKLLRVSQQLENVK